MRQEPENVISDRKRDAMNQYSNRTDLALEINERLEESHTKGIEVYEELDEENQIKISYIEIVSPRGEELIGKPMGKYITLENMQLATADEELQNILSDRVAAILAELLKPMLPKQSAAVLVLGLGNRDVTPDCLGPLVTEYISVMEYGKKQDGLKLTALAPGVCAQTGMETATIVEGVVKSSRPDAIIAIDALAARSFLRLNTTVQLSDKGIHPGSGVGNHRIGITEDIIGVPVISIGVPTVIEAATIVMDALDNISAAFPPIRQIMDRELVDNLIEPSMSAMYVTPKDVDASVSRAAMIIASAVDKCHNLLFPA